MLTLNRLKKSLGNRYRAGKFNGRYVYLSEEPLSAGSELKIGRDTHRVEEQAFLVIIGGMPGAFFHNPITYELHQTSTGEIETITEPMMLGNPEKYPSLKLLYSQQQFSGAACEPELGTNPECRSSIGEEKRSGTGYDSAPFHVPTPATENRHAVLLGGGGADFQYDIAQFRNVLMERYAYKPENIIVLLQDGSNFDEIGLKVDGPANRTTFSDILMSYTPGGERRLGEEDSLFLYVFAHGRNLNGSSFFATCETRPGGEEYTGFYHDFEMGVYAANIRCGQLVVVMNPCESGGFVDTVIDRVSKSKNCPKNTVVTSACSGNQLAWTLSLEEKDMVKLDHGGFSAFFYSALNHGIPGDLQKKLPAYVEDETLSPDVDGDGRVSIKDAWSWTEYIMKNHRIITMLGLETPKYGEYPPGAGDNMFLGEPRLWLRDADAETRRPDIFFMDPAILPNDVTTHPQSSHFWGTTYRSGKKNRIAARVFNIGSAPCSDVKVEFRIKHMGRFFLIDSYTIHHIDPGKHAYAHVQWNAFSRLVPDEPEGIHVHVTSTADPAVPFSHRNIENNRHQCFVTGLRATEDERMVYRQVLSFRAVAKILEENEKYGNFITQDSDYRNHIPLEIIRKIETNEVGGLKGNISTANVNGDLPAITGHVSIIPLCGSCPRVVTVPVKRGGHFHTPLLWPGTYRVSGRFPQGNIEDTVVINALDVTEKTFLLKTA